MAGETPVWLAPPEFVIVQKLEILRKRKRKTHPRYSWMLAVTVVDRALIEREVKQRGLQEVWRAFERRS